MAIQSQISAIVASQTGKIQGELEARVLSEAFSITDKFRNECPTITGLENIVITKNTLLKVVNSFSKTTNKFGSLAKSLLPIIQAAKALISLLKADPTPIAIGIPPAKDWGGLINSKTSGNQNSSADRLRKVDKLLEAVEDDVASIKALVGDVDPSLNQVRNVLNSIDTNILNCIVDIIDTTENTTDTGQLITSDNITAETAATTIGSVVGPFTIAQSSTSGTGTGATFTITGDGANAISTIIVAATGTGYAINDTITITSVDLVRAGFTSVQGGIVGQVPQDGIETQRATGATADIVITVSTPMIQGSRTINIADIRKNLNSNTESLTANQVRVKELLTKIQPSENTDSGEVSAEEFTYTNPQGISYTLEIQTITEINRVIPGQESSFLVETEKVGVSFIAPKRYAQAKNKNGVVILRGPASFSADTQILLDELKFKLDNQLA